ncbi:MAG TPA: hypothetical protein VGM51_17145 [Armatimonadota bacterium]|jgi:hypothetical protein
MRLRYTHALSLFAVVPFVGAVWGQQPSTEAPAPPVIIKAAPKPAADDFYLPLPPRFVAGPMVSDVSWSPDGHYVAAIAEDLEISSLPIGGAEPARTLSLTIWNASTHRSAVVWSTTDVRAAIQKVSWFTGSPVAFVSARLAAAVGSDDVGLWRVDARRMSARRIEGVGEGEFAFVSPNQPYAFLVSAIGKTAAVRPLAANGLIGSPVAMSQPATYPTGWTQDGRALAFPPLLRAAKGTATPTWQVVDGRSGTVSLTDKAPALYAAPARVYPYRVNLEPVKLTGASAMKTPWDESEAAQAWLEQGVKPAVERMLIAADARRLEISPRGDAIVYVNGEGAFVVGLLRMPKAVMENARTAAQRTQILSNGKQIALGVIMWSQDHGDNLPAAGGSLKETLGPYLKNDAVFEPVGGAGNTFVYTLNGGSLNDIKDPANTMLGYIPAPGGYGVDYADGHVQWQTELPKPPPPQ